jgi:hypothetical protein
MRYIQGYDSHRRARQADSVNEEFLPGLFNFVKKMFNKVKTAINKIKGGKKCEEIYKKYLSIINTEISKKANIDLSINATLQAEPAETDKQAAQQKQAAEQKKNESAINEAQEPKLTPEEIEQMNKNAEDAGAQEGDKNKKIGLAALKEKKKLMDQIITLYKNRAIKEMDVILKNYGGAEKNPKLAQIIDNFKDQFQIDLLSAQMRYLEQSGDKNAANKLATELAKRNKELDAKWNLDKVEFATIKVGGLTLNIGGVYRYNSSKGIKTIKIKKVSQTPGEVIATYVYGDTKDKEQSFKAANIDVKFVPEVNSEYGYWSNTNNAGIKVKVIGKPDAKGLLEVQFGDNKFKVYSGALVGDGKTVDLSDMNPEQAKPQENKEGEGQAQGSEAEGGNNLKAA